MITELLSCPFCGGPAEIKDARGDTSVRDGLPFYWVQHESADCPIWNGEQDTPGMETGYFDTAEQAAEAWNRRR
jgi:hypothetical protein